GEDFCSDAINNGLLVCSLFERDHQRNHYLRRNLDSLASHVHRGFKDGTRLHLRDLRIGNSQTAATQTEHGIEFMQFLYTTQEFSRFVETQRLGIIYFQSCYLHHQLFPFRKEFVKRWIEQTNGYG